MKDIFRDSGRLFYGADYNPDQWLDRPDILARDIELMQKAKCSSMTLGVFSWTSYEPEEGHYQFEWLDLAFERLHAAGIKVILATPTGAKPAWMSETYPEIRRVDRQGRREPTGGRHNHCPSSKIFRAKSRAINEQLAQRYGHHPALLLWHLNNEISGECFCENCLSGFRKWLQRRYGSLKALNEAWWTGFWNHTFTDWSQIAPFDPSIDGMALDWRRYVNDLHVETLENEMVPLRRITPDIPCTTNFMSTFDTNNYYQWSKVLDVISNDRYPLHDDREDSWKVSLRTEFINALMRGMADGKSWIQMECSPSSVNWWAVNKLKRPGVHYSEAMQYLAHGADVIHYFQWRKGRGGGEKYHGAVIDHEGSDQSRVFQECQQVGESLEKYSGLAGVPRKPSRVGIVYDWESKWALQASAGPKVPRVEYPKGEDIHTQTARDHYNALVRLGVNADITFKDKDWSSYQCLVLPSIYIIEANLAEKLKTFVEGGGCVVATYLTGYVDDSNRVWTGGLPGSGLRSLFGVWSEEIDYLFEDESNSADFLTNDKHPASYPAMDYAEILHAEDSSVLAVYGHDFYAGKPVITQAQRGHGNAFYCGARLTEDGLIRFYQTVLSISQIPHRAKPLHEGVVMQERTDGEGVVHQFLFNFTNREVKVKFDGMHAPELSLSDEKESYSVTLAPYGTEILISDRV
jgi:beta-galactosidase